MIQARNEWIVFRPGESKMDGVTGNLLHSAYQQQNEQWKKPSIKEEEKATELTLKNTKGKEGWRYPEVSTICLNTGKFFTLAEQSDLEQSLNNWSNNLSGDKKTEEVKLRIQETWLKPQGDPVTLNAIKPLSVLCNFVLLF